MRITVGFIGTWMSADNQTGGAFQYAERLLGALVRYTDLNMVAIITENTGETFAPLKEFENFKEVLLNTPDSLPHILESESIDVVHTPVQSNNIYTTRVPMIITLHDLQHMHYPENFSRKEKEYRAVFYKKASEFSERVIVSYDHVKDDIVKYYKIAPDKIDVCPIGIDPPLRLNNLEFIQIKKKYGLPDNYLFYAANTWRHKNHVNLIRAMKIVQNKYGQNIHLICTGRKQTDYFFEIEKEIEKYELNEHIKFLGYIPEAEMMLVMRNAKLVVIPTYYEAGSFPLIEAMNYGVPVICSDVTSLPQQIGDSQYVFNPTDIDEMAAKIHLMLVDKGLQLRNIENSKNRISELRWDTKVNNFVDSYKNAIAQFDKRNNRFFEEYVNNFDLFINSYYQNACLQYREAIDGYEKSIKEYEKCFKEYEKRFKEYEKCIEEEKQIQNLLKKKIERMQNTFSWKITAPLRESKSLKKVLKILKLTS